LEETSSRILGVASKDSIPLKNPGKSNQIQ
jgi:hypothetical protein